MAPFFRKKMLERIGEEQRCSQNLIPFRVFEQFGSKGCMLSEIAQRFVRIPI